MTHYSPPIFPPGYEYKDGDCIHCFGRGWYSITGGMGDYRCLFCKGTGKYTPTARAGAEKEERNGSIQ